MCELLLCNVSGIGGYKTNVRDAFNNSSRAVARLLQNKEFRASDRVFGELDQKLGLLAVKMLVNAVGTRYMLRRGGLPVCAAFPRNVFSIGPVVSPRDTCHFCTKMASFALPFASPA